MTYNIFIFLLVLVMFLFTENVKSDEIMVYRDSFSIHGIQPPDRASRAMSNRIDESGLIVYNPTIGATYTNYNNYFIQSSYLKDCYDFHSVSLTVGKLYKYNKNIKYGVGWGGYIREVRIIDGWYYGGQGAITIEENQRGTPTKELYTSPVAISSFNLPINKQSNFNIKIISNYLITHAITGIAFNF